MFLFVRVLPLISIFEMRTLLPEAGTTPPPGAPPATSPVMEGGSH